MLKITAKIVNVFFIVITIKIFPTHLAFRKRPVLFLSLASNYCIKILSTKIIKKQFGIIHKDNNTNHYCAIKTEFIPTLDLRFLNALGRKTIEFLRDRVVTAKPDP